jgi:hypothetical protein
MLHLEKCLLFFLLQYYFILVGCSRHAQLFKGPFCGKAGLFCVLPVAMYSPILSHWVMLAGPDEVTITFLQQSRKIQQTLPQSNIKGTVPRDFRHGFFS